MHKFCVKTLVAMSNFENTLSFAQQMDEKDPLKSFRERFHLPNFHEKTVRYSLNQRKSIC
jgi:hypothetical protein